MRARLTVWFPKVGFAALVGTFAVVPVAFTRRTAEAFMVPKVTILWLGLIVATVGLAAWGIAARRWPVPRTSVVWPFALLLGWTALATTTSTSPITSLIGQYGRYDGLLGVVAGALLVALVVGYAWRAPARLDALVLAQLAAAALCLGYVTIQQLGWDWIQWINESLEPIARPYGLLGNSNFSGAHLAMCIPPALALALRLEARWQRAACWAFAALLAAGVWWTGTRGGLLAAVGGVAAAGALVPRVAPRLVRWGATGATVVGLTVVLAVSLGSSAGPIGGQVVGSGSGQRVLSANTLLDRREIWSAGVHMALDRPLTGVGPDAFGLHMADYRRPDVVASLPLNADEAHDVFIDRAATAGFPALAAYLWLLGTVAVVAWRARRHLPPEHRWLLASFGGSLGAYLVQGLFSIDVVPLAMVAWVSIGALLVLGDPRLVRRREAEGDAAPPTVRPLPLAVSVALIVGALLLAGLAVRPFAADLRFRDGLLANAERRPGLVGAADFHAATTWNDVEPRYHERLGQQLVAVAATGTDDRTLRTQFLREAVTAYDHALEVAPGEPQALRLKASALALLGTADPAHRARHLRDARAIYEDLVDRIPSDPAIWTELGRVAELQARRGGSERSDQLRAADRAYRRALALDTTIVPALVGRARVADAQGDLGRAAALLRRALAQGGDDTAIRRYLTDVEARRADQADGAGD
ncbi:MAG: O-antigen ligase family protein [Acidimicrobiales bacterium]